MRRRKRPDDIHENTQRWLLTYADLITLLLAFFIVMYSMSNLDAKKFGQMSDALNGILKGGASLSNAASEGGPGGGVLHLGEFRVLQRQIQQSLRQHHLEDKIKTIQDPRGLVIRVLESAAFDPGKADLKPELLPVLRMIVNDVALMPNHLRVEGHTDNTPIHTAQYPSNWELSTARATQVVRYMVEQLHLDPERVSALGYAEYRPVASNFSSAGRTRNRRVDIVVLAKGETKFEPKPSGTAEQLVLADSLLR